MSRESPAQAFQAASVALAQVGTVRYANAGSGTVSGECAEQVDATILVSSAGGRTSIMFKSKIDAKANSIVIETGDRDRCLNQLEDAVRQQGV